MNFFDKEKTRYDYSLEERVEIAKKFKEEGNLEFKNGNLTAAEKLYD